MNNTAKDVAPANSGLFSSSEIMVVLAAKKQKKIN